MTQHAQFRHSGRRWFVTIDSETGETLDVADLRSRSIDGVEHVEVVPRAEVERLRHIIHDAKRWLDPDVHGVAPDVALAVLCAAGETP